MVWVGEAAAAAAAMSLPSPSGQRQESGQSVMYTVWRPLGRDVLLCFLSEVPVTNWSAQ